LGRRSAESSIYKVMLYFHLFVQEHAIASQLPRKINGGDQEFFDYILSHACDAENQKDERNLI
jgi:hypothetical protein